LSDCVSRNSRIVKDMFPKKRKVSSSPNGCPTGLIGGSTDHGHRGQLGRSVRVKWDPTASLIGQASFLSNSSRCSGNCPLSYTSRITALRRSSARTGCGIVTRRSNPLCGHQDYNPKKFGRPSHVYHSYMLANLRLVLDVEVVRAATASVSQPSIGPYPSLRWSLCCKESQLVAPRSSSITPRIVVYIKIMAERSGRQCHSTYACEAIRSSHCARARISSVGARPRTSNTT